MQWNFIRSHYSIFIIYRNYGYSAIEGFKSRKIYRLSDDEREWIEVGKIPKERYNFGVASLNGRIYITGGTKLFNFV